MKILQALSFRKFFSEAGAAALSPRPATEPVARSLPVIGQWPVARQFQMLLALLAGLLLMAALLVALHNREAAQTLCINRDRNADAVATHGQQRPAGCAGRTVRISAVA
jgi:hypothetical protein